MSGDWKKNLAWETCRYVMLPQTVSGSHRENLTGLTKWLQRKSTTVSKRALSLVEHGEIVVKMLTKKTPSLILAMQGFNNDTQLYAVVYPPGN